MNSRIRPYAPLDENDVLLLWDACGLIRPVNDPVRDIQRKLHVQPDLFLVAELDGRVIGTLMAGYEGHRGWINYPAVAPSMQKSGVGKELMQHAETLLRALGCPKINLQVHTTNTRVIAFYERLGYAQDDVVSLGKRLIVDDAP